MEKKMHQVSLQKNNNSKLLKEKNLGNFSLEIN